LLSHLFDFSSSFLSFVMCNEDEIDIYIWLSWVSLVK